MCRADLFLTLLLLFFAGCATPEPEPRHVEHPEKYRKVYLVESKGDPRQVIPRILSRLQLAGFDASKVPFDTVKKLQSAAVENDADALVCMTKAVSAHEEIYSHDNFFQTIEIDFFDLKKGDLVFKVNYFNYHPNVPENTELNRLFVKISDEFFPGQPNPFIEKK